MPKRLTTIFIISGTILVVAVSARFIASPAFTSTPDAVQVTVTQTNLSGTPSMTVFAQEFHTQAGTLYHNMTSLRVLPSNAHQSCGAIGSQSFYHYTLIFYHAGIEVATANVDAWGCEDILIAYMDGSRTIYFAGGSAFFDQLHQLTGAPLPILS